MCVDRTTPHSFWVAVHITVGEEFVKNDSETPDVGFVGESGLTDGFWGVPGLYKHGVTMRPDRN